MTWVRWRTATEQALYGEHGFYRSTAPSRHFRTSVHASARFASALCTLLERVDTALGRPQELDVVDMGAGRAELLLAMSAQLPAELNRRVRWTAVELATRPHALPTDIRWRSRPPERITGLVIANEWLDNIPVDVVVLTEQGPRLLLVDPATGQERPGDSPTAEDLAWLARWWPLHATGDRAEMGRPRDEAWCDVVRRLDAGLAVAIDYAHQRSARPAAGTLDGYRDGRRVRPVPDGSCDITAHVALDACAAAGTAGWLTTQAAALRTLGLSGARPQLPLAHTEPRRYLRELVRSSEEAELLDPHGLGGFGWLLHGAGLDPRTVMGVTIPG